MVKNEYLINIFQTSYKQFELHVARKLYTLFCGTEYIPVHTQDQRLTIPRSRLLIGSITLPHWDVCMRISLSTQHRLQMHLQLSTDSFTAEVYAFVYKPKIEGWCAFGFFLACFVLRMLRMFHRCWLSRCGNRLLSGQEVEKKRSNYMGKG